MYSIGGLTFQKRKKLTINNNSGSTLTNYQVMVTVTYDSDMKSTFDDIRFAYPTNTLIDFWLELKTDYVTANFWVEVDLPNYGATPTGDNYIYMYYGNPSAASASNGTNTFIREIDGGQPVKGAWTLDNNALDLSGNANHGTLNGGMGYTTGKFGQAGLFDGTDDYIGATVVGLPLGSSVRSVSAWFKTNSVLKNHNTVFAYGTAFSGKVIVIISIRSTGLVYFESGSGNDPLYSATSKADNIWHLVTLTYDGTYVRMYVDSVLEGTSAATTLATLSSQFQFGNMPWDSNYKFTGSIDEGRIYNRVLTQAEITDLYNNNGYTTTNYPGRELVRKYASPEPAVTATGQEEHSRKGGIIIY